ncbi:hypothetical protein D931_03674 [Enterococcus faecium 13.SD.W.09]|nr:hypothetical protein D931_03674 [Enterococcus faecium 13.SD.W.09]
MKDFNRIQSINTSLSFVIITNLPLTFKRYSKSLFFVSYFIKKLFKRLRKD